MNYEQAINTAIGCIMASYLTEGEKRACIDALREIEEKICLEEEVFNEVEE